MWHMTGHIITVVHTRGGCIGINMLFSLYQNSFRQDIELITITLQNLNSEYPFAKELVCNNLSSYGI